MFRQHLLDIPEIPPFRQINLPNKFATIAATRVQRHRVIHQLFLQQMPLFNQLILQQLTCVHPIPGVNPQTKPNEILQIIRVLNRYPLVDPTDNRPLQRLQIVTHERRSQRSHLIEYASQRPDVALGTVGLLLPHFRTRVVGRAGLSARHPVGSHDRDVHICQFDVALVLGQEDIGALDVPVQDVHLVQRCETLERLVGHQPYHALIDDLLGRLVLADHLEDVAALETLSDDAEGVGELVEEGVLVAEDVRVLDAGQDAHLIEAIGEFLLGEAGDAHLLHRVLQPILLASDAVDHREGALAQFGNHGVLIHQEKVIQRSHTSHFSPIILFCRQIKPLKSNRLKGDRVTPTN